MALADVITDFVIEDVIDFDSFLVFGDVGMVQKWADGDSECCNW
ncbi:hypothetical protein [[Phormidium] sp. ETS-05]|nr:hypothetical protein [[Phormidium] sp. ETS-05]